jgi:hypothetical protein
MALGRLANYSDNLAEAVVQNEILPQLVSSHRVYNLLLAEADSKDASHAGNSEAFKCGNQPVFAAAPRHGLEGQEDIACRGHC